MLDRRTIIQNVLNRPELKPFKDFIESIEHLPGAERNEAFLKWYAAPENQIFINKFRTHGNRKKTGGREQGTPNRLTKDLRNILKSVIEKELNNLPALLEKLEPERRAELVIKLMPYIFPKVENIPMDKNESWTL